MAQLTESDKLLSAFESKNTSLESWILLTSEGVPFKFSGVTNTEAVKICGMMTDLVHFTKRTIEDLKKGNLGNICIRLRQTNGMEYIIKQENDFFLITLQMCKAIEGSDENEKVKME